MDYKAQQDAIKEYIETNLPLVLQEISLNNFDAYVDDFLDLDMYTKAKQLFYGFNEYNYNTLTNESKSEEFQFSIYLVFRKDKREDLKAQMLNYASAFDKMFEDSGCNFGGIADYGEINTVQFYLAAEGNLDVKVAELSITLYTERD